MFAHVWLDSRKLAQELGVSQQRAREILRNAAAGQSYCGAYLTTRPRPYGTKVQYEVLASSIPPALLREKTEKVEPLPTPVNPLSVVRSNELVPPPNPLSLRSSLNTEFVDWIDLEFDAPEHTPFTGGFNLDMSNVGEATFIKHELDTALDDNYSQSNVVTLPLSCTGKNSLQNSGTVVLPGTAINFATPKYMRLQGSHDTSIGIRSDGKTVSVVGNVGRWGYKDNLFGLPLSALIDYLNTTIFPALSLPATIRAESGQSYLVKTSRVMLRNEYNDQPEPDAAFRRAFLAFEGDLNKSQNVFNIKRIPISSWIFHLTLETDIKLEHCAHLSKPLDFKSWNLSDREYDRICKYYYQYRFDKEIYGYKWTWEKEQWTGVKIHRIDITRNYAVGSHETALDLIHAYSFFSLGKLHPNYMGSSIYWGSLHEGKINGYVKPKVYNKALEMLAHAKKSQLDSEGNFLDPYLNELFNYLKDNGVIRYEISYNAKFLNIMGLGFLGDLLEQGGVKMLAKDFDERFAPLLESRNEIKPETLSPTLRGVYNDYLQGMDFRLEVKQGRVSKPTFYRWRNELKAHGVDIANTLAGAQKIYTPVRLVVLRPLEVPAFYQHKQLCGV